MTLHAPHLGRLSSFVHDHHVASVIAAVAIVGGGTAVAGVAWNSTQATSSPAASQAGRMSSQATSQVHRWTAHHRAYMTQMSWLRHHHGYQGGHSFAHYRATSTS